jgi:hypothetical protein
MIRFPIFIEVNAWNYMATTEYITQNLWRNKRFFFQLVIKENNNDMATAKA